MAVPRTRHVLYAGQMPEHHFREAGSVVNTRRCQRCHHDRLQQQPLLPSQRLESKIQVWAELVPPEASPGVDSHLHPVSSQGRPLCVCVS